MEAKIRHVQNVCLHQSLSRGSRASRKCVAQKVESKNEQEKCKGHKGHFPTTPLAKRRIRALLIIKAPRRLILHADPKKTQEDFGADRRRETQGEGHDNDMTDIGQNMFKK